MTISSVHLLTIGSTQRDLRTALCWSYNQPTAGLVTVWFTDNAHDATKLVIDSATWDAAKGASMSNGG